MHYFYDIVSDLKIIQFKIKKYMEVNNFLKLLELLKEIILKGKKCYLVIIMKLRKYYVQWVWTIERYMYVLMIVNYKKEFTSLKGCKYVMLLVINSFGRCFHKKDAQT